MRVSLSVLIAIVLLISPVTGKAGGHSSGTHVTNHQAAGRLSGKKANPTTNHLELDGIKGESTDQTHKDW
jgi:hypothetical protein